MVQQTFGSNNKGKAPVRPRREDESTEGSAEAGTTDPISYSQYRDRAMSPDQVRQQAQRAKSPPSVTVGRTVSPNSDLDEPRQPPNMVSVSMGMNGAAAERGSPAISAVTGRTSPTMVTNAGRASPVVSYSVSQNGSSLAFNGSFPPRSGSGAGTGSVGSVAADLVKDLKAKDFELDGLKRQMSWMKEALSKAAKAGYVLPDRQGSPDLVIGGVSGLEGSEHDRAELLFKFKQFRAEVQVK